MFYHNLCWSYSTEVKLLLSWNSLFLLRNLKNSIFQMHYKQFSVKSSYVKFWRYFHAGIDVCAFITMRIDAIPQVGVKLDFHQFN